MINNYFPLKKDENKIKLNIKKKNLHLKIVREVWWCNHNTNK